MRSGYACLLAFLVALSGQTAKAGPHPEGRALAAPPSIILILSDDEDVASHDKAMTKTQQLIERQGVVFKNFFVTQSYCCPSRATFQRGQYPHNTGIEDIVLPLGGYLKWKREGCDLHTVATWLQKRGYRTVYAGKYLNYYYPKDGVPHGWDEWYVGGDAYGNFDYDLNENGRIVHYGSAPEDYLTDVLARKAVDAMQRAARDGVPLFMIVAPFTPHAPAIPAPRHLGRFAHEPLPHPPSFAEADLSDKGYAVRDAARLHPFTPERIKAATEHYRARLESLLAIDDLVETVVRTAQATGIIENYCLFYASDNGFHQGENHLIFGKTFPYENDLRVPFAARCSWMRGGETVDALVLNNDFAPTVAAIAGVSPDIPVDGRSFLPLLEHPDARWSRQCFMTDRRTDEEHLHIGEPAFIYDAIRCERYALVRWGNGDRELYDLTADPYQLDGATLLRERPALAAALEERLDALLSCKGAECRRIEDLPEPGAPAPLARIETQTVPASD